MDELKPCPFCGKPMHTYYDCRLKLWTWNCGTADCAGNMLGYDTEEEAAAALNRRPSPENKPLTNFERIVESPEALAEKLVDASYYQESAFSQPAYVVNKTEYRNRDNAIKDMTDWLNEPEVE